MKRKNMSKALPEVLIIISLKTNAKTTLPAHVLFLIFHLKQSIYCYGINANNNIPLTLIISFFSFLVSPLKRLMSNLALMLSVAWLRVSL